MTPNHLVSFRGANSTVHIYPINGACHDVASDPTAFGHRNASFATVIAGMWPDPAENEANIRWVKDYYQAIAPHCEAGGYINFASAACESPTSKRALAIWARQLT